MQRFSRPPARRPRRSAVLAAATAVIILGSLGLIGSSDATPADFRPKPTPAPAPLTGDDNGDGRIDEDETGWDCRRMGNRVCGPQRDASHTSR